MGQLLLFANQVLICGELRLSYSSAVWTLAQPHNDPVILLIRIYAIYARDVRIVVLFAGLGVITAALTGVSIYQLDSVNYLIIFGALVRLSAPEQ